MGFNIFAMLAGLGPYAQARASAVLTPVLPSPYPRPDEGPYGCLLGAAPSTVDGDVC